ncbi:FecCD family ABC transporter permease [Actinotalea fermentans]|uniref:Iron ABC transporter permease n=1 Tax=Actinotalea fermentans TaxID=43671 RepID=A0A511YVH0_9CELL|nr:iron ABC transporter permease [Actinotalea fermentans]GEN79198.1 iron ABC transporter permease [Actinotalea fermentans]
MTAVATAGAPATAPHPRPHDEGATLVRAGRRRRARRARVVTLVALAAVVALVLVSLALGTYAVSPAEAWAVVTGQGAPLDRTILLELRLPRALLAVVVGVAFALAGGIFQTVFANPLASPDLLGVTGGATVAAVWVLLVLGVTGPLVGAAAFAGAAVVAGGLLVLTRGRDLTGHRFVLTGVGVAFMASGAVGYLLSRAQVQAAQSALVWTAGSLGAARWDEVALVAGSLALAVPALVAASRPLRAIQLGPLAATGLGVRVERTRAGLLAVAVVLVAGATAVVGPLGFVALCAPPLARRLVRTGAPALPAVGAVGAVLVLAADLIAQHAIPGVTLPTGVVTGAVGAPYLLWLLARGVRS